MRSIPYQGHSGMSLPISRNRKCIYISQHKRRLVVAPQELQNIGRPPITVQTEHGVPGRLERLAPRLGDTESSVDT